MSKGDVFVVAIYVAGIVAAVFFMGQRVGHESGFSQGQRDALDGKWRWVKVRDADGKEYVVEKR